MSKNVNYKKTYAAITADESKKKIKKVNRNKRMKIFLISLLVVVVLVLFPSIVNLIVQSSGFDFLKPSNGVSKENQWVGFLASYSGSIFGGIIGGMLTLLGVILTLRNTEKQELIEKYPEKRRAIKKMDRKLEDLNKDLLSLLNSNWSSYENLDDLLKISLERVISQNTKNELVSVSESVSGYSLLSILDFIEKCEKIYEKREVKNLDNDTVGELLTEIKLQWRFTYVSVKSDNKNYLDKMADIILRDNLI